tara:strand:+ start:2121 stop:3926 length:1806 start_codon:yes stop_codon:yes gene_type:complete
MPTQGASITVAGGLDLVSSAHALFRTPGAATILQNFESATTGGYRRINGFAKWGGASSTSPSGTTTDAITGIVPYANGVIACQGNNIYWSTDGITWLQINKDTYKSLTGTVAVTASSAAVVGTGTSFTTELAVNDRIKINSIKYRVLSITDNTNLTLDIDVVTTASTQTIYRSGMTSAEVASATTVARTNQTNNQFANYESNGAYGTLYIVDSTNKIAEFQITTSGGVNTYYFEELERSAPVNPKRCTIFAERLVVAGQSVSTSTVAYSSRLKPYDFEATGSGTIDVGDIIVGIKVFRNTLIIFCKNSIFELTSLDSTPILKSITKNIGCIDGNTIQEVGGDLIFLAPDGLRTVAGTARIADVEIGSVSRKILPLINDLLDNIANYTLSSMVIRERSQYRLFYFQSGQADSSQKGIIGTFKFNEQGIPAFEWSNTRGLVVKTCTSDLNTSNEEVKFSADESGYVYLHDSGNSFNGENISGIFQTPDMDYGDNGLRKSLYAVKANIKPEGTQDDLKLRIRYDFASSDVPQPGVFNVGTLAATSLYGSAVYGSGIYGAVTLPSKRMVVIGSGFSNSFRFYSNDTNAAYAVNGLFVSFIAGGRR